MDTVINVPSPLAAPAPEADKKHLMRIPLYEQKGKYKKLIGYFFPERNWVVTPKGEWSVDVKLSSDGKTMIPGNQAHKKRMHAAFNTEDFTYREQS